MSETNKQQFVRTLREIADYLESRPFDEDLEYGDIYKTVFCRNKAEFGRTVAAAGNVEKNAEGNYLDANIMFGYSKLQFTIAKKLTCQRIKVGEKTIPATEEFTVPAEPERVEEVYRYECPDSFLSLKDVSEEVPV